MQEWLATVLQQLLLQSFCLFISIILLSRKFLSKNNKSCLNHGQVALESYVHSNQINQSTCVTSALQNITCTVIGLQIEVMTIILHDKIIHPSFTM